eukprot:gene49952-28589_t
MPLATSAAPAGGLLCGAMPPCGHNNWDNHRAKRGWCVLRCRMCRAQWKRASAPAQELLPVVRFCDAFRGEPGCKHNHRAPDDALAPANWAACIPTEMAHGIGSPRASMTADSDHSYGTLPP